MNEFDTIVKKVMAQNPDYSLLQPVVEKEILHHDILRIMNEAGYLKNLTFIGGTGLRMCYGSERLSEDLDFTSSFDFSKSDLAGLGTALEKSLNRKYNLKVTVTETHKEHTHTDTWKIKMITRPERPDMPAQRINIDICHLPAHDRKIRMLNNYYSIALGTEDLLLYAESLEEILCDKLIAVAFRLNRVKNRDLWDIFWMTRKNIKQNRTLLLQKLADRNISPAVFAKHYSKRLEELKKSQKQFIEEMRRFLFPNAFTESFMSPRWWEYLLDILNQLSL